jgi:hypothetical protein
VIEVGTPSFGDALLSHQGFQDPATLGEYVRIMHARIADRVASDDR